MCGCNQARTLQVSVKPQAAKQVPLQKIITHAVPQATVLQTVDTSVWGARMWSVLHAAAAAASSRAFAAQWNNILSALRTGLPCPDCSAHFNAWYAAHPLKMTLIPFRGAPAIVRWFLDLHNDVNLRTGRPVWTIAQLNAVYDASSVNSAKAALASLQGIIGPDLYSALATLLATLAK